MASEHQKADWLFDENRNEGKGGRKNALGRVSWEKSSEMPAAGKGGFVGGVPALCGERRERRQGDTAQDDKICTLCKGGRLPSGKIDW